MKSDEKEISRYPLLSEIPIIGKFLFSHDPLVYLTLILIPILCFVLFKTRIGLQIRSIGENPAAVDAGGPNVFKYAISALYSGD